MRRLRLGLRLLWWRLRLIPVTTEPSLLVLELPKDADEALVESAEPLLVRSLQRIGADHTTVLVLADGMTLDLLEPGDIQRLVDDLSDDDLAAVGLQVLGEQA